MEFTINQIAEMLQGKVEGNGHEKVNTIGKIQDAQKGAITFLSNPKYEEFLYSSEASAVIVKKTFKLQSLFKQP
jgi:UDP-3-O-[3-hydroxymyristoyl] glucosamine N-acyltransferase